MKKEQSNSRTARNFVKRERTINCYCTQCTMLGYVCKMFKFAPVESITCRRGRLRSVARADVPSKVAPIGECAGALCTFYIATRDDRMHYPNVLVQVRLACKHCFALLALQRHLLPTFRGHSHMLFAFLSSSEPCCAVSASVRLVVVVLIAKMRD